jgi:hypothetical protein
LPVPPSFFPLWVGLIVTPLLLGIVLRRALAAR